MIRHLMTCSVLVAVQLACYLPGDLTPDGQALILMLVILGVLQSSYHNLKD
jgi:hypothetical protein